MYPAEQAGRHRTFMRRLPLAASLIGALSCGVAFAQSITGGLYGKAQASATIEVKAIDTGVERSLKPDADGRYSAVALNPGRYSVKVLKGSTVVSESIVTVVANTMSPVSGVAEAATGGKDVGNLAAVQVTGLSQGAINPIDVSTPQLTSSYDMKLVNDLPMGRSPESIALLRSNVRYDAQTTGLVQMGGATPAENRYYYNEFDTTNDHTALGAFSLPSEAIGNTQVLSGNFGASWTNTTGGIMSSTIRQGSNHFEAGYSLYYTPPTSRLLNPRKHDVFDSQDNYYSYDSANTSGTSATQYLWASGALVKDKLFFFALLGNSPPHDSTSYGTNSQTDASSRNKSILLNTTWNITDNQSLNVVGYRNWQKQFDNYYSLTVPYDPHSTGPSTGWYNPTTRNKFLIGNYHWQINDDLSMRLMAGHLGQTNARRSSSDNADGLPYVTAVDPATQITNNIGLSNNQTVYQPDRYMRIGYKGDFTWQLGDHKLVFGAERYRHFLYESWATTPGGVWTYYDQPGQVLPNGAVVSSTDGNYVSRYYDREYGDMYTINKAAYLEDYWQLTDRFMLYGALRGDIYTYKDAIGRTFFRLPMLSPRLGFSWDAHGDSTLKVGGNLGKYSVQLPSNFSFGVAESKTQYTGYYTYTGMDPNTKVPTGLQPIGDPYVTGNGIPQSTDQIGTTNIKGPYQYAFNLYAQQQFNPTWSGTAEFGGTYLKRVINETCNEDAVTAWAQSHGFPNYAASNSINNCFEFNPGQDVVLVRDFAGNGTKQVLAIPASAFGIQGPKHTYYHLTLDLSHTQTADEPYYLDLSYTFTRSYGNDDGLLDLSRRNAGYIGQTSLYDYPQMQDGANGNLMDDIRNSFVASGVYYFKNGFRLGGLLNANTGAPLNCFGSYPDASIPANYNEGASTHYCNGNLVPRGTAGRLPFFWSLGLSIGYDWKITPRNKLSVDLQVQNITNRQGVIDRNQTFDTGQMISDTQAVPSNSYGAPTWQTPRTTTLALRYVF